eukprot:2074804-Rhodomonas_salina.1
MPCPVRPCSMLLLRNVRVPGMGRNRTVVPGEVLNGTVVPGVRGESRAGGGPRVAAQELQARLR